VITDDEPEDDAGEMFVKICGVTTEEDALLAIALGADAIGFMFAPSPRQVAAGSVADIVKRLPREVLTVGVFRNEAPARVVELAHTAGLGAVQLHGHEPPEHSHYIRERIRFLIQAFPAGSLALAGAGKYAADAVMIDSATPGSGRVFDWALAEGLGARRLMLAGGLTAANVARAITQVRPWAVDVSTGVERAPGIKDPVKLRAFIAAAKAASSSDLDSLDSDGGFEDELDISPVGHSVVFDQDHPPF